MQSWGWVLAGEPRSGWDGQGGAPGGGGVLASQQQLGASPARVAHWAPAHGLAQPGGWDGMNGESTGSSTRPGTPRVGFSDSWLLQELYPPKAGSSECPILLQELDPPSRVGSFKNWILQEVDPLSTTS